MNRGWGVRALGNQTLHAARIHSFLRPIERIWTLKKKELA
jgi:hypothetical protein